MKNIAKLFALMALLMIGANNSILQAAIIVDSIYYDVDNTGTSAYNIINTIERPDIREEGESEIKDGDKFEKDGIFYTVISVADKTVEVTFGGKTYDEVEGEYSGEVIVPQTVNYGNIDFKVVGIGYDAFFECSGLTSVTIPNSVTSIGGFAFSVCEGLTSVTIPNSVTSIGEEAFAYCNSLASIILEGGTPPEAHDASFNTYETTVLIVPTGAKSAYQSANVWKNFATIREVGEGEIRDGDKFEKDGIFYKIVSVEDKTVEVTFTGESISVENEYSGNVVVPQTVNFENNDFNVIGIGDYAFYFCQEKLLSITLPQGIKYIGREAFEDCYSLESISLPDGLVSIGDYAFRCCGLELITLPESLTSIGYFAFYDCHPLEVVNMKGSTPPTVDNDSFNTYETTVLIVPVGAKSAYQSADVWKNFATIREVGEGEIKDGDKFEKDGIFYMIVSVEDKTVVVTFKGETYDEVEGEYSGEVIVPQTVNFDDIDFKVVGIVDGTFVDCKLLKSIVLPSSVTRIGNYAFGDCSGLTSIEIPKGITEIGAGAFDGCSGLTSVVIPEGVTEIGYLAFGHCSGLTSIEIPKGITEIGSEAFSGCSGLTSIELPESVISIGDAAFGYCSALTSVKLSEGVISIGRFAFLECSALTSIEIPSSVTSIGEYAFYGCSGLTSIKIPEGVTIIDERTFYGCIGLESVIIPSSVTSIGEYAFYECSALKSIEIPENVTSIGGHVFFRCEGLTSIVIPSSVTSIGGFAFHSCSGLTSIEIPAKVTSIGTRAFGYCYSLESVVVAEGNEVYDSRENCNAIIETKTNNLILGCKTTTIPSSVTSIGEVSFYGCLGLTSIELPESVTSIGGEAFYGCSGLASINIKQITPPTAYDNSFTTSTYETAVLTVPAGAKSAYQSADVWKKFATIREEGEGEIKDGDKFEKDGVFYKIVSAKNKTAEVTFKGETYDEVDNEYQGDVVIPQTVSYEDIDFTVVGVGEKALYGCDNIRRLSVPLTVSYFDKGAVNSETLRELYWNSTMAFSKSVFVNPDAATNMILYITAETACDYDGNVVRDGMAEEILLTDALPLQITTGFKAKRISYTRHFDKVTVPHKPGGWESIVLPFDVQSFLSEEAGEIAPFNSGNAGARPFMLAQMTGSGFAVATEMKANVPYILVMPNSEVYGDDENISGNVMFCAESAGGVAVKPTVEAVKAEGSEFDLVPSYEGEVRDFSVYALNEMSYNDMLPGSAFVSGLREVKPFEAYASVESKPANAKTHFVIGGNGTATDIMRLYDDMFDGLEIDSRDGVLYIQSPKAQNIGLYGSDGRLVRILRLTEGSNTVTGLSKGVYVIGKKKVGV